MPRPPTSHSDSQSPPHDTRGFHQKFHPVVRTDGTPVSEQDGREQFVLFARDPWARKALLAYAEACQKDAPQLAGDLRALVMKYEGDSRNPHGVAVGQIWRDLDPRKTEERTIEVLELHLDDSVSARYGPCAYVKSSNDHRRSYIRLDRFKKGRSGYELVEGNA